MLECWNSGGCAGLGNLYIFTVVVVMRYDSNRDAIRVHFGFHYPDFASRVTCHVAARLSLDARKWGIGGEMYGVMLP